MPRKSRRKRVFFELTSEQGIVLLRLNEPVVLINASGYNRLFDIKESLGGANSLRVDCSAVSRYDSFLVLLFNSLKRQCNEAGAVFETVNLAEQAEKFLLLLASKAADETPLQVKDSFWKRYVDNIGEITLNILRDTRSFIAFFGELFTIMVLLPFNLKKPRWKDFPLHLTKTGVDAVGIVVLILFLIGIISGYQGALQLRQFGADKFIADLIGISITRELAPLMTAIIVAGRSGSAFTAEIGTMKVSEEIDALRSMGFDIMHFLVVPRVLAVMLAMPVLTLLADVAGIGGGLVASLTTLNITMTGYLNQMQFALGLNDIFSGLIKSVIFGGLIATVGCFRGMQVSGGAESVGRYTTASVVTSIFLIIFTDAIFTFLFQVINL